MSSDQPEIVSAPHDAPLAELQPPAAELFAAFNPDPDATPDPPETRFIKWAFMGPDGLRAGWSILAFIFIAAIVGTGVGAILFKLRLVSARNDFTASTAFFGELISFVGIVVAAVVVAFAERRRNNLLAYNLTGPHRLRNFVTGFLAGFLALSALIGALDWGHWLHFGPVALSGATIFKYAAVWGAAFLLVGCVEEGIFRCFLQATLTRGLNFWWALGIVGAISLELIIFGKGNGIWGVYIIAALGLIPCLLLHMRHSASSGFWQAAWVTSTLFGFVHTGNNGENWIGIFAAAAIGFVFVVSIWATGSAWWAIGCHAAWDWAETYFYGAADSGNVATGHYLTTTPAGNAFWSGGTDGPEGSVLVLGVILLLLIALVAIYGRKRAAFASDGNALLPSTNPEMLTKKV
jgi:hypothetical protein